MTTRERTAPLVSEAEVEMSAVRSQGAGGQNVNKVASAVHLRFDVRASSLSLDAQERLLALRDRRITEDGIVVIKAQRHRTQEQNRAEALERLNELVRAALVTRKVRKATRPTRASQKRRVEGKKKAAQTKTLRRRVDTHD